MGRLPFGAMPGQKKAQKGQGKGKESWFKYLICDSDGELALCRLQMIAWTPIAIGIYVFQVVNEVGNPDPILPDVADSMLVLMGISQGAYLGKKLVTATTPILAAINSSSAKPGDAITVTGMNLGDLQAGSIVKIEEFVESEERLPNPRESFTQIK